MTPASNQAQGAQVVIAGFPITDAMGIKRHDSHLDVPFTISNHGRDRKESYEETGRGTWCYYVTVSERMVSEDAFAEFWLTPTMHERAGHSEPSYDYWGARFAGAEWHGGVTYYEKLGGIDGTARAVKIGCDFAHHWDQGCEYDYACVEREARLTIDALRGMYEFKRRCSWSGRWLPEAELATDNHGRLYHKATKAESEAKFAAIAAAKGEAA